MKTIKELSIMCDCSKTTINRAIKELNIETVHNKNRLLISDTDTERIYKYVVGNVAKVADNAPNETEQAETATNIEKSETFENNRKYRNSRFF